MKPSKFLVLSLLVVALVSGCATAPGRIAPNYVSPTNYSSLTVEQLREDEKNIQSALDKASAQQESTRTKDTWGIILLGLPVSSLSGSNQAQHIADLKGQLAAIRAQITKKVSEKK
jgi:uncharacterized protein YceK